MQIWFSEKALAIKSIHIPGIKNSKGRVLAQAYILRFCLRCFFHIYTRTVMNVNIFAAVVTKNKKHVLIKIATMIMMMMTMRIMMTVIIQMDNQMVMTIPWRSGSKCRLGDPLRPRMKGTLVLLMSMASLEINISDVSFLVMVLFRAP